MNASKKCAGCRNPLPKRDFLQCVMCKGKYDIECANISHKVFSTMENKEHWKCPECKSKQPKRGNTNTPVRSNVTIDYERMVAENTSCDPKTQLVHDNSNVTRRAKLIHKVSSSENSSPSTGSQESHVNAHSTNLDDLKIYIRDLFQSQIEGIREAINSLTNTIKAQNNRIEQLEARVILLETRPEETHTCSPAIESIVTQLQRDIAERDQALLSNDLEISGCPEVPNENCTQIITAIARKIGVEIDEKDIVSAERTGPPRRATQDYTQARPRPLTVRLTRRATRDTLLQAARIRRDLNTESLQLPEPPRKLYINERLSKRNRQLFQKAREISRENGFKYVWIREGNIFVRQEQGKQRYRIRNEMDLLTLFKKVET